MTVPSAASSAAPTLKFENVATAWWRARRAASTSDRWSEAANDVLQQPDELSAYPFRRRHHLVVIERLRQHAGGHVRDARDPEHIHTHVTRRNRLRHGGHPDRIGADRSQIADFSRRFVTRTEQGHVDAMWQRHPEVLSGGIGDVPQARRIDLRHVRKARAKSIVV